MALPKIEILRHSKHFLVINKPPSVLSQGAGSLQGPVLMDLLQAQHPNLFAAQKYPYHSPKLVHRLDASVTGAMVLGISELGTKMLSRALKKGGNCGWPLNKYYGAILQGNTPRMPLTGNITMPISGKPSLTKYKLFPGETYTLAQFQLLTGRKHQLRKHASDFLGQPIVEIDEHQIALHAHRLHVEAGPHQSHCVEAPVRFGSDIWSPYLDPVTQCIRF